MQIKYILIFTTLFLCACTSMSMKTIYKLATTDPISVDPNLLRAAIRMPEWISPKKDGVKLQLTSTQEQSNPITEIFTLESIPLTNESKALIAENKVGYKLYAYKIASQDIPLFFEFRNNAKHYKNQTGKKSGGTIGVSADACRRNTIPEGKILVSTHLRFEADAGYFPLLLDYDLRKIVKKDDLSTQIPICNTQES